MSEIVYILENEAMPGIIKIGRTSKDVRQRVADLSSSTAVPYPFRCVYAATVDDAVLVERQIHMAFAIHRIRKEFFKMPAHCVISVLELVARDIVTPTAPGTTTTAPTVAAPTIVPFRRPLAAKTQPSDSDKQDVIAVLRQINRPVTNTELAALMQVTTGESSKRTTACGDLLRKQRSGRHVLISLAVPVAVDDEVSVAGNSETVERG